MLVRSGPSNFEEEKKGRALTLLKSSANLIVKKRRNLSDLVVDQGKRPIDLALESDIDGRR